MGYWGKDEFLTITDTGGKLCEYSGHTESLDIYIGEGRIGNGGALDLLHKEILRKDDITIYVHREYLLH